MKKLKKLLYTIRYVIEGKQLIENELKYKLMCYGAAIIHFIFCVCMFCMKATFMAYYNVIIVGFYFYLGSVMVEKERFSRIQLLLFLEIELHSALMTFLVGPDFEFMLYTVALIPGAFYLNNSPTGEERHLGRTLLLSAFVMLSYLTVSIFKPFYPVYYDTSAYPGIRIGISYFNIFIAFLLLFSFSLLFALETGYMSGLLEKENVKLGEEASFDPLTQLWNRRTLTSAVTNAINLMEHEDLFTVVMMDIDNFKRVNDTYGHDVGDDVLVGLAGIINDEVRDGDYSCRWGGEEFLLFLHGARYDTYHACERICKRLSEMEFTSRNGEKFNVTVTMGMAEYRYGMQLRNIIEIADKRLYFGKTHGKNQVVTG